MDEYKEGQEKVSFVNETNKENKIDEIRVEEYLKRVSQLEIFLNSFVDPETEVPEDFDIYECIHFMDVYCGYTKGEVFNDLTVFKILESIQEKNQSLDQSLFYSFDMQMLKFISNEKRTECFTESYYDRLLFHFSLNNTSNKTLYYIVSILRIIITQNKSIVDNFMCTDFVDKFFMVFDNAFSRYMKPIGRVDVHEKAYFKDFAKEWTFSLAALFAYGDEFMSLIKKPQQIPSLISVLIDRIPETSIACINVVCCGIMSSNEEMKEYFLERDEILMHIARIVLESDNSEFRKAAAIAMDKMTRVFPFLFMESEIFVCQVSGVENMNDKEMNALCNVMSNAVNTGRPDILEKIFNSPLFDSFFKCCIDKSWNVKVHFARLLAIFINSSDDSMLKSLLDRYDHDLLFDIINSSLDTKNKFYVTSVLCIKKICDYAYSFACSNGRALLNEIDELDTVDLLEEIDDSCDNSSDVFHENIKEIISFIRPDDGD